MRHAVIYVPGLGDHRSKGQRLLISTWWLWGVRPYMVNMVWNDGKFAPKLQKLVDKIDGLRAKGYLVSLVGASAGAGAVLNAFAARKEAVEGVVLIAGWVNFPEHIGADTRRANPAFVESAYLVQPSLNKLDFKKDRRRIQSRYALFDPVVPMRNSEVVGGRGKMVPSVGHSVTIATQLLFGAPFFLRFLKMVKS